VIALELDGMEVRAAETRRNERIADRAERLAAKAAKVQDWTAAAALQRSAIAASREVSRLAGAYAPKDRRKHQRPGAAARCRVPGRTVTLYQDWHFGLPIEHP
jgi:hypothetical protein